MRATTYIAFGCTSEILHWQVFGCRARGAGPPVCHSTGVGRVDAHTGYYADAHQKGHRTELLLTEASGAVHGSAVKMLRHLERDTNRDAPAMALSTADLSPPPRASPATASG